MGDISTFTLPSSSAPDTSSATSCATSAPKPCSKAVLAAPSLAVVSFVDGQAARRTIAFNMNYVLITLNHA